MSSPTNEQDLVGNLVTCSDLLNVATLSAPYAIGSGLLASGAYVPGQVALSSAATSNTYQVPIGETLLVVVQLASGTGTVFLNTGATTGSMSQVGSTGSVSTTVPQVLIYQTPVNAITASSASNSVPYPGTPSAPYFNVSFATSGMQIAQLAVFALGKLAQGTDFVNVRAGINACASEIVNTSGVTTIGVGNGSFVIDSTV